jgi:serine/threonine-protein kinase
VIGGRYELVEPAGVGGMARVWRARVLGAGGFQRVVAVKQMHPHLAEKRVYVDMFFEEARIGAELHSPNIAQIYDCVAEGDEYFLVMEWVDGIDLGTWVRYFRERGDATRWELVTGVGVGLLRGLAAAHERVSDAGDDAPVVHRDVSPHNVLLTTKGHVKLIDFGLALAADRGASTTEPGIVKGKMAYLSPEVVTGERPRPASDQFAAAAVLWEALVGRKLFVGETDFDVYKKVRDAQAPPLRPLRPDVPKLLVQVIGRALAREDRARFPSVREMARQLGLVLKHARARRDLHELLGRSVVEVREAMTLGHRTGDPETTTPVADLSDLFSPADGVRGLRHRLPFFRREG